MEQNKNPLDCVVAMFILAPNQWKDVNGIKIENTTNHMKRIVITVVDE